MKRFFALFLAMVTLLSLCLSACEDAGVSDTSSAQTSSEVNSSGDSSSDTSFDTSSDEPDLPPIEPQYATVVSTGASYTVSHAAAAEYADSYTKELTDGQFAPTEGVGYSESKLSGYATSGANLEVVLDLGETIDKIHRFEVSYLNANSAGIAAPGTMIAYVSEDGENWERVGSIKRPSDAIIDTMQVAVCQSEKYWTARYVRFRIAPGAAWIFLDELQVCADVEGEDADEAYLELLKGQYEKDTVTAIERENMLSSVRGDAIDRDLNCNLISVNRTYKTSIASHTDYADSGSKLTDGVMSRYFEGGTWVGFRADEEVAVTIDLKSERADMADFTASVFVNTKIGIFAPVLMTVEISSDGKTFTQIGRVYGPSDTSQECVEYRLCLSRAVKGRYVRFTFVSADGDIFLIEECGVYAYGEKAPGLSLYPEVVLPQVSGNDLWSSSESDYDKEQNLILGLPQQIMSCDSATSELIGNNSPVTDKTLTDGKYAGNNTNIHNGIFFKFNQGGSRDIVYDLGHLSEVRTVKASILSYKDWGVNPPSALYVYVSEDGDKWYQACELVVDNDEAVNQTILVTETFDKPYKARFVAFSFDVKTWAAIDELEVIGTKKISGSAISPASAGLFSLRLVPGGYQQQDKDLLNGAGDICLMYHGANYSNTVESLLPYVGYLNTDGQITDTMFDGFLFLLTGGMPVSGNAGHLGTIKGDWEWMLNDLFAEGENIDALNTVAGQVNQALGTNKKYNFYVALYYPNNTVTNFGDVDGDGTSENFNNLADRFKAIEWYMTEFESRLAAAGYDNLSFGGYYWYNESVSTYSDDDMYDLVRGIADRVHARNTQFFWIPYFTAAGYSRWASFGFDVACYQPNYAFNADVLESRLAEAAAMMRRFGMCTEMEISGEAFSSDVFYEKYMNYIKYGVSEGYYKDALHMYYQDTNVFGMAAHHSNPKYRLIYDYTYQFIKETLKTAPDKRDDLSFSITADTPYSGTLALEGETVTSYRVAVSPAHGTVTINNDGTFVYYPDEGYTGTDSFAYAISDQLEFSEPCVVEITIE